MFTICVAGKNDIAVNVLTYIHKKYSKFNSICIIANASDIGKDGWQKSFRKAASDYNIHEVAIEDIYNIKELIFLSCEYDKIIKPDKFQSKKLYNIHFSLLPAYKGMYTSTLPILYGEKYSGVTLHEIDEGIDTGDIIAQQKIEIAENWTAEDLYIEYVRKGTELIVDRFDDLIVGNYTKHSQSQYNSTYYSKGCINFSDTEIDFRNTAYSVRNQVRAYYFKAYQRPTVCGEPIRRAEFVTKRSKEKPGTIIEKYDDYLIVATIDYDVLLIRDKQ